MPGAHMVAAGAGCAAIVAMAALALQMGGSEVGVANLRSSGSMTTGLTTTVSIATVPAAATRLDTSEASPSVKATPAWGQPTEP